LAQFHRSPGKKILCPNVTQKEDLAGLRIENRVYNFSDAKSVQANASLCLRFHGEMLTAIHLAHFAENALVNIILKISRSSMAVETRDQIKIIVVMDGKVLITQKWQ
jgi:hypothetical protein